MPRVLPVLVLLLTAFTLRTDSHAHVEVTGDLAVAFDGYAYAMGFEGFSVLALASAPLQDGRWAHGGSAFDYVELRLQANLASGTYRLADGGGQGQLTLSRWNAEGDLVDSFFVTEGTLVIDTVQEGIATGSLTASLSAYDDTGDEQTAHLAGTFTAHPGIIPSP